MTDAQRTGRPAVKVRALREPDLPVATRIMQQAFGAFLGAADPARFMADRNYVQSRWRADPSAALAAVIDGEVVGSNLATRWGSVGYFGPLTVAPDHWDRGVASRLLEPTLGLFTAWNVTHAGLFTFTPQPEARGAVPEVRVLAPLSHRGHVQAGIRVPGPRGRPAILGDRAG